MNLPRPTRRPLEGERFQVIVIGGGINGVAIARECALAGRRTLLVEQNDFASGTSSRSTRIIHGGLRYLEHGEIGLVRDSLRERQRLQSGSPHLIQPIHFLLALDDKSRRSALSIRLGLWLYGRMGGKLQAADRSHGDHFKLERILDAGRKWSVFNYEDAQCEFPERLIAEWLVEAIGAGAIARNHTQVLAVDIRHGRAQGVLLRDELSGREERVESTWVINASGPWVDRICQRSSVHTKTPMVGGVRGSHLVFKRFPGSPEAAVYSEAVDKRPIFVIPWNEQVLVGTTEIPDGTDPSRTQPSPDEIEYLLRSLLGLFPRARVSAQDIQYSFAGVRPLPYSPKQHSSSITRRHILHDHKDDGAANMISIIGGKLTTAAQLAREVTAQIGAQRRSSTGVTLLSGKNLDPVLDRAVVELAEAGGISEGSARAIAEWHGKRSSTIAEMAKQSTAMRAPLCRHNEHIVAEAIDALKNECAVTLSDILLRRVPVALGACWSSHCGREAAMRIGTAAGWSDFEIAGELEAFETEREGFLRKPSRSGALLEAAAD